MKRLFIVQPRRLLPGLLFTAVFILYAVTAAPSIYPRDSAELVVAAHTLGIAHPPGYPLYVLLGKLFELIVPWGSVAFQLNLFSAFTAAAAVTLVFLIIDTVTGSVGPALVAAITLATSRLFWFYSTIAEVLSLHALWLLLVIWLLLVWQQHRTSGSTANGWLYLAALLFGLGFGNHHTILLMLPAVLYVVWVTDRRILRSTTGLKALMLGLGGIAGVYSFVYLRSKADPFLDWGDPQTFSNLLAVFFRQEFGTFSLSKNFANGLSVPNVIAHVQNYFASLSRQFFGWGIMLGLAGLVYFFKKRRTFGWLTALSFAGFGPLIVLLTSGTIIDENVQLVVEKFYLASFVIFSLWIGGGIWLLLEFFKRQVTGWRHGAMVATTLLLVLLPAYSLTVNWSFNDRHAYSLNHRFIQDILGSVEPNGIIITPNDSIVFGVWYFQQVLRQRLDVAVVPTIGNQTAINQFRSRHGQLFTDPPTDNVVFNQRLFPVGFDRTPLNAFLREIIQRNIERRPIYFPVGDPAMTDPLAGFIVPGGLVYRLTTQYNDPDPAPLNRAAAILKTYPYLDDRTVSPQNDFLTNEILARYALATLLVDQQTKNLAD